MPERARLKIEKEEEGMLWTNGIDIFGTDITLAEGLTKEGFYKITREEYNAIVAEREAKNEIMEM